MKQTSAGWQRVIGHEVNVNQPEERVTGPLRMETFPFEVTLAHHVNLATSEENAHVARTSVPWLHAEMANDDL